MYYIPLEMRRAMLVDCSVLKMFMLAPTLTPPTHFSGVWETYQGELYVTEDKDKTKEGE